MMEKLGIKVKVEPGMFSSERFVTITTKDTAYFLFVDASSLEGDILRVYVVYKYEESDDALVDLPQDTLNNGSRVRIPRDLLVPLPA
jgi:hypothetical protein